MIVPNYQSPSEQIAHLAERNLFDIARNDSSIPEFRKAAVQILREKGYASANHPTLAPLLVELQKESEAKSEVESIVEAAIESEIPQSPALTASVTTHSLFGQEVRNPAKLGDDALAESVSTPSIPVRAVGRTLSISPFSSESD